MVQLSNDCFAFAGKLLPIEEVEGLLAARVTAVREVETAGLSGATGRVLAADLVAPVDLPPFDNSAVDGYAVRHADLNPHAETRLLVVDRVTAGQIPRLARRLGIVGIQLTRRAPSRACECVRAPSGP